MCAIGAWTFLQLLAAESRDTSVAYRDETNVAAHGRRYAFPSRCVETCGTACALDFESTLWRGEANTSVCSYPDLCVRPDCAYGKAVGTSYAVTHVRGVSVRAVSCDLAVRAV